MTSFSYLSNFFSAPQRSFSFVSCLLFQSLSLHQLFLRFLFPYYLLFLHHIRCFFFIKCSDFAFHFLIIYFSFFNFLIYVFFFDVLIIYFFFIIYAALLSFSYWGATNLKLLITCLMQRVLYSAARHILWLFVIIIIPYFCHFLILSLHPLAFTLHTSASPLHTSDHYNSSLSLPAFVLHHLHLPLRSTLLKLTCSFTWVYLLPHYASSHFVCHLVPHHQCSCFVCLSFHSPLPTCYLVLPYFTYILISIHLLSNVTCCL